MLFTNEQMKEVVFATIDGATPNLLKSNQHVAELLEALNSLEEWCSDDTDKDEYPGQEVDRVIKKWKEAE